MERQPGPKDPESAPEFERRRSEEPPRRQASERVQRALGQTAASNTVQNPSSARSERVQRAIGRTAVEGASEPSRTRSRDRG